MSYQIALKNEQIRMLNELMITQEKEIDKLKKEFIYEENFDSFIEFLCELSNSKIDFSSDTLWASLKYVKYKEVSEDYPTFKYRWFNRFFSDVVNQYGIGETQELKEKYLVNIFKQYLHFT